MSFLAEETIDRVNREAISLFEEYQVHMHELSPMLYDSLAYEPELLVLGINPSFDAEKMSAFARPEYDLTPAEVTAIHTFSEVERHYQKLKDFQRLGKQRYNRYFQLYSTHIQQSLQLSPSLVTSNQCWEHIDLLWVRLQSMNDLTCLDKRKHLTPFGKAQVSLTLELLNHIQPQNLLVANARASHLLLTKDYLGDYDTNANYIDRSFGGKPCRIFFSAQWTVGQLDVFSRSLLLQHMKANLLHR